MPAASPAPASIHTSFFAAASFFADSGTIATRDSPGSVSRTTATRITQDLPRVLLDSVAKKTKISSQRLEKRLPRSKQWTLTGGCCVFAAQLFAPAYPHSNFARHQTSRWPCLPIRLLRRTCPSALNFTKAGGGPIEIIT